MTDYQDYGFPDEGLSHAHQYLLPALLPMLDKQQKILDLGCGNGALAIKLIGCGYNVYGMDASEEGIKIARTRYPNQFFVQNLSEKKLPTGLDNTVFSTLISTEVIEHLYDPKEFIAFCKHILSNQKHNTLIISTPYHGYLKNLALAIFNQSDKHYNPLWSGGHIKFWSRKTLGNLLESFGFEIVEFKGCGRFPFFWKSMLIKATLK